VRGPLRHAPQRKARTRQGRGKGDKLRLKQFLVILALAPAATGPAAASVLQPFSLICPGAAVGRQPLQLDVHAFEGWYDSGLAQGEATYANKAEVIPDGIWLWLTGTLKNRRSVEWTLKSGRRLYSCREIGFQPLKNASNPF
jgi:hypothetical protein